MPDQSSRRDGLHVQVDGVWRTPGELVVRLDPRRAALRALLPLLGEGTVNAVRHALARHWLDVESPPDLAEGALVLGELSGDLARRCREQPADEPTVVEADGSEGQPR